MSITRETTVWCDGEGCYEWHQSSGPAAAARSEAKVMKWKIRKGLDLCPKCYKNASHDTINRSARTIEI